MAEDIEGAGAHFVRSRNMIAVELSSTKISMKVSY